MTQALCRPLTRCLHLTYSKLHFGRLGESNTPTPHSQNRNRWLKRNKKTLNKITTAKPSAQRNVSVTELVFNFVNFKLVSYFGSKNCEKCCFVYCFRGACFVLFSTELYLLQAAMAFTSFASVILSQAFWRSEGIHAQYGAGVSDLPAIHQNMP